MKIVGSKLLIDYTYNRKIFCIYEIITVLYIKLLLMYIINYIYIKYI